MNLAAESHVDRSIDGPAEFIQTNIVGTFTLLQEALRYWHGLDPCSAAAASASITSRPTKSMARSAPTGCSPRQPPTHRTRPTPPPRPHQIIWCAPGARLTACRRLVTNCSNNYGPYHFPEKLIPHIIIKSLAGEPLPVYGDGQNIRDWLYVEDHARALTLVAEHGVVGETYNIGGRNERTNLEVVTTICRMLDALEPPPRGARERLISFVPDRAGHDRRYAIDASKIERELGWKAVETFETGLAKTVRWYCNNRDWWQTILDRGYKAERIGLSQNQGESLGIERVIAQNSC